MPSSFLRVYDRVKVQKLSLVINWYLTKQNPVIFFFLLSAWYSGTSCSNKKRRLHPQCLLIFVTLRPQHDFIDKTCLLWQLSQMLHFTWEESGNDITLSMIWHTKAPPVSTWSLFLQFLVSFGLIHPLRFCLVPCFILNHKTMKHTFS